VRLEGNSISALSVTGAVVRGALGHVSTLKPASSLRVAAVGGVGVPLNPTGSFQVPDAVISSAAPVSVEIQATGIPVGTVVTLQVYPETPDDSTTVYLPAVQVTLAGSLESSTATAMFTFPFGYSRCFIRATWTQ
jgi:hypothetical protein